MLNKYSCLITLVLGAAMAAYSQTPVFGPLGDGGMPKCLHEINPGIYVPGELVLSKTAYTVWVARKRVGQEYKKVTAWKKFGPFKLDGGKRHVFTGEFVADNLRPGSTAISSGLASLHFENRAIWPVWIVVNPLPPGCGKLAVERSGNDISSLGRSVFDGSWPKTKRQHTDCGYSAESDMTISTDATGVTRVISDFLGNTKGKAAGRTLSLEYGIVNGIGTGTATITLSEDGRSFTGTFSDKNGHRGTWSGKR